MKPMTTLRKAFADNKLLGSVLAGDSWQTWRTLLIAAMELISDGWVRINQHRLSAFEADLRARIARLEQQCAALHSDVHEAKQ